MGFFAFHLIFLADIGPHVIIRADLAVYCLYYFIMHIAS